MVVVVGTITAVATGGGGDAEFCTEALLGEEEVVAVVFVSECVL